MAYPDTYKIEYSYTGFAAGLGNGSFPGTQLDNDLAGFGKANANILAFLQSTFRSDGKLHNNSVGPDQLSPALKIGFTNRGQWQADTRYDAGDGVVYADRFYSARKQHKATDANRPGACEHHWLFLFHVSDFAVPGGSIVTEKLGNGAVTTEKLADGAVAYGKLAASALDPYPTVIGMPGVKVPGKVSAIRVSGHSAPGDGGAALYRKVAVEPNHAGKFQTLDGAWWEKVSQTVEIDVLRSVLAVAPGVDATASAGAPTATPDGEINYFNTIFSHGSALHAPPKAVRRTSVFGHAIGEIAADWERVEAFGNGAMRFAKIGNRNSAMGSLSLQWQGNEEPWNYHHDFWTAVPPSDPSWDAYGLEARNPGIRSMIAELASDLAITKADVRGNVSLGRNSLLHHIQGQLNTALGYNAGAHSFVNQRNVYVGYDAGRDNVIGWQGVFVGSEAGLFHQQGNNDTFLGNAAARDVVRGGNNVIIGSNAARNIADMYGNVILGYGAGQNIPLNEDGSLNDRFIVQNNAEQLPLMYGTFVARAMAFGYAHPENMRGQFTFTTNPQAGTANGSADDLVVVNNGNAGITVLTPSTAIGQIAFGDEASGNVGGIRYNHANDRMYFYIGGTGQMVLGASGHVEVTNLPSTQPSSGSKRLWYDPNDSNRVKFAA